MENCTNVQKIVFILVTLNIILKLYIKTFITHNRIIITLIVQLVEFIYSALTYRSKNF